MMRRSSSRRRARSGLRLCLRGRVVMETAARLGFSHIHRALDASVALPSLLRHPRASLAHRRRQCSRVARLKRLATAPGRAQAAAARLPWLSPVLAWRNPYPLVLPFALRRLPSLWRNGIGQRSPRARTRPGHGEDGVSFPDRVVGISFTDHPWGCSEPFISKQHPPATNWMPAFVPPARFMLSVVSMILFLAQQNSARIHKIRHGYGSSQESRMRRRSRNTHALSGSAYGEPSSASPCSRPARIFTMLHFRPSPFQPSCAIRRRAWNWHTDGAAAWRLCSRVATEAEGLGGSAGLGSASCGGAPYRCSDQRAPFPSLSATCRLSGAMWPMSLAGAL
ncbi:hypothetical protein PR202_gb17980 [Eleusine coracana subsp. coracana]|uniref:Uncharacterized protein n=1 Tax=Eleusine coracana subsp. coracana TaxID=191504 RepID=A0AAV5F231_ELECO|nr:hypothetical protein PR202_gb17980 [Eleusine coracana subsp. coracana]